MSFMKNQYKGEFAKNGAWTVCRFKGRAQWKRGAGIFQGGGGGSDTPMYTMLIRLVQLQCKSTHFEIQT